MANLESPSGLIQHLMGMTVRQSRPSLVKLFVGTLLPPLVVLAFVVLFRTSGRYPLFTAAIIACAWFGGFASGVVATVLSTALMWWFFVEPTHVVFKPPEAPYIGALVFLGTGILISAILRRLRRTAAALAQSQQLLQGIVEHSPNGIAIKDLERRYIVLNKAFEHLEGLKLEDTLQRRAEDVLPSRLADVIADHEKEVLEKHTTMLFEARFDGHTLLISHFPLLDESQRVFAIGAIATDITRQKLDQEALQQSLSELRIAEHVAHVGSWRWDFRTNKTTWSDELYEIFGIERDRSPLPLLNPGLRLLSRESVLRVAGAIDKLRNDGAPFELDLEFTRPDGATRWCAARGEAIRDAQGRITGVAATAADITHIMHLERLREEWTSIVAHDLRQPISVISNASELIPELYKVPGEELSMLQRIQSAAGTLKRMVDDLLDASLLEAHHLKLERTVVDPGALVREAVERVRHVTGDRVEIAESGSSLEVCVDPMRIEQVLGNLLSNAAKYGDANSPIHLQLDCTGTEVQIAVMNRGKGVPADELPRLFNRFARSRTTVGSGVPGLGLGLYITKEIVEAHGGRIWAESEPGKTTTFHIALPAAQAQREAA
jgi:PAS domain S-box-containing protein